MSGVICYIQRAEQGLLPVRLQLISAEREDVWSFPDILADDRPALMRALGEAASWMVHQLKNRGQLTLDALILDADGTLCSWLSTPSTDPLAVNAILRQAAMPMGDDEKASAIGSPPHLAINPDLQVPSGVTVQPLDIPPASPQHDAVGKATDDDAAHRRRLGVLTVNDSTVRLLMDELDNQNIETGCISTIFHAMTSVLDSEHTTPGSSAHSDRIIESPSASTTAQIVLDSDRGRLLWTWSRMGIPIAAGSARVPQTITLEQDAHEKEYERVHTALDRPELARLATAWIAWATQLGASPAQIKVVLPEDAWAGSESLGETLIALWPGATVDIVFDDTPLDMVLSSFATQCARHSHTGKIAQCRAEPLATLAQRPGRQHRSMYRWSALAIALAACGMGIFAWKIRASARDATARAAESRQAWRDITAALLPKSAEGLRATKSFDSQTMSDLQSELTKRTKALAPIKTDPEMPVLEELETLSFVLGNPDYKIEQIAINKLGVFLTLTVPNTAAYEELTESLGQIAGSHISKWESSVIQRQNSRSPNQGVQCNFTGIWKSDAGTLPKIEGSGQT